MLLLLPLLLLLLLGCLEASWCKVRTGVPHGLQHLLPRPLPTTSASTAWCQRLLERGRVKCRRQCYHDARLLQRGANWRWCCRAALTVDPSGGRAACRHRHWLTCVVFTVEVRRLLRMGSPLRHMQPLLLLPLLLPQPTLLLKLVLQRRMRMLDEVMRAL